MNRARAIMWLGIAGVLLGASVVRAESEARPQVLFQRANEAYRQSHFAEAVEDDQAILARGTENGVVYYNLGNAFLKNEQVNEALWAYLKAKQWLPRDADVQANLEYAQSLRSAGSDASLAPARWIRWLTFRQRCTTRELAWWAGALSWVAVLGWILVLWLPAIRRIGSPAAWLASLSAAAFLAALMVQAGWVDAVPTALTVRDQVEVKFAPQATGTTHYTLPAGTRVRVLGREGSWVQVRRADGRAGWISAEAVRDL